MDARTPFSIKLSAPGKVILFGEYSVVYKKPAIAATLCLRTSLHLQETTSGTIQVNFTALGLEKSFPIKGVRDCINITKSDSWDGYVKTLTKAVEKLYENTYGADDLTDSQKLSLIAFFHTFGGSPDSCEGFRLRVDSELPVGSGVGSSASFSVVLSSAAVLFARSRAGLNDHIKRENHGETLLSDNCKEQISELAFSCEKIFHGSPSGVDHNTILQGSMLEFIKLDGDNKKMSPVLCDPIRILLVNTNVPRSTKKLVQNFKELKSNHPEVIECVLDAMGNVAKSAVNDLKGLRAHETEAEVEAHFGELMSLNHGLLRLLGASHPSLELIVSTAEKYNLKAKLTGAGGGGFGFIYVPANTKISTIKEVSEELTAAGFTVLDVTLGGPGLSVEELKN